MYGKDQTTDYNQAPIGGENIDNRKIPGLNNIVDYTSQETE